ncbi:uncharacterized protein [Rutidosis leptorrhynchoides]|uniref:uncharacterized protein n=1 Tax=Rutidosis leptorrhynchoides TaxID=125765 RepID=UPI003A9918A1
MDHQPPQPTIIPQDSFESSSPTCRQWDETLPPPKLRMMCSYGGHIIPRPHDKSLCYMGGETRIVVADRHTSLSDLSSRLSTTLLHGRQFSLKYQLPSEDLDSLVSVTTDEDLDNMIEEYDRLNASNPSTKPSRLRLFLFLSKPDTAASMGSLLDDAKSETWFVDALNGAGLLPRGLSDSATIDNLLEHKDGAINQQEIDNINLNINHNIQNHNNNNTSNNNVDYVELQEMQRRRLDVQLNLPDSPLVETNSSFGSSSSTPSMSNLPPIKVRVDQMNQMAGLDEQLSQLNVNVNPIAAVNVGGNWAVTDEERSDHNHGVSSGGGMRKPPLPLQVAQRNKFGNDAYNLPSPDSKHGGAYGLHSPDSVASDSSIASASKPTFTQDVNPSSIRDTLTPNPSTTTQFYPATTINYQIPNHQIHDPTDTSQPQQLNHDQQQQFYQQRPQYIQQHHATNQPPQPISSYYPMYAPPQQLDHQQYPCYFLPISQNHPYGMQLQSNPSDATATTTPPLYPPKTGIPLTNQENTPTNSLYTTTTPVVIQVPTNQFQQQQQQYVNVSQMPHQPRPSYHEYAHPTHDQLYYSQHHSVAAPNLPSQYQTMTPASAMLLAQVSTAQQPAVETAKQ